jgi:L-lactate dehydrogenase complex protein LldF
MSAGETIWTDDPRFAANARRAVNDAQLRRNVRKATTTIRERRAGLVAEMPDWQDLRTSGAAITDDVPAHLDRYLEQFEAAASDRGAQVHWARDADEANGIVSSLVQRAGQREVIKSKSMLTEEIGLNDALAKHGITATETDLAEVIIQLGHARPSHIVVPTIHKNRAEIREIFLREMDDAPADLSDHPHALAEASRRHLRRKFFETKVAVTGANFAVAETGSLLIAESEGNARMCLTLPETLISVVGIEKLVPTFRDLEVFLQLLPRSSTGEQMNPYTSAWTGVTPGDGPHDVHIVLVDNGRTNVLRDEIGRQALRCIRCAACLNVCPVYERAGGHAYGATYPGPIGAILTPQLVGVEHASRLPFASSLCGYCYEVCPVKIDIPTVLVKLRHDSVKAKKHPAEGALSPPPAPR